MPASKFNYIITIHNKEQLIEQVIRAVLKCCGNHSHVYTILDGCTDRTEKIIDSIIKQCTDVPITKVYTPDVHEILSINAGLKVSNQEGNGYNIILQDDVILTDFMLEEKVTKLYEWAGPKLGFVSFRLGANFAKDAVESNEVLPLTDYIENAYGHGLPYANVLLPGQFAYRTVPIKSPVCIPFTLIRSIGILEEQLAPYMCDDFEYAIRSIQAGFRNGVFGIPFQSEVKWGTTRIKPDPRMSQIQERNMKKIREWHAKKIADICSNVQNTEIYEIPSMFSEEDKILALTISKKNREELQLIQRTRGWHTYNRIQHFLRGIFLKAALGKCISEE